MPKSTGSVRHSRRLGPVTLRNRVIKAATSEGRSPGRAGDRRPDRLPPQVRRRGGRHDDGRLLLRVPRGASAPGQIVMGPASSCRACDTHRRGSRGGGGDLGPTRTRRGCGIEEDHRCHPRWRRADSSTPPLWGTAARSPADEIAARHRPFGVCGAGRRRGRIRCSRTTFRASVPAELIFEPPDQPSQGRIRRRIDNRSKFCPGDRAAGSR